MHSDYLPFASAGWMGFTISHPLHLPLSEGERLNPYLPFMKAEFYLLTLFFGALFLLTFQNTLAAIQQINPENAQANQEASLLGSDFGDQTDEYTGICFNTDKECYVGDHEGIKSWSSTQIRFIVPYNIEPVGNIYVYGKKEEKQCYPDQGYGLITTKSTPIFSAPYSFRPTIEQIMDSERVPIDTANPGDKVIIAGSLFGTGGIIKFGSNEGKVISWQPEEITVEIPQTNDITYSATVIHKQGSISNQHDLAVFAPPAKDLYASQQINLVITKVHKAWERAPKMGQGIVIAVIDTGINLNHPDLKDRIWKNPDEVPNNQKDDDGNGYIDDYFGYNFITNSGDTLIADSDHATMIAGIIAAQKDNQEGIAGIATQATIMPLVACTKDGCSSELVKKAIRYAADNQANIINLSLGGPGKSDDYDPGYDQTIAYAYNQGMVIVVAAGNGDYLSTMGLAAYGRFLNTLPNSPVCNDGNQNMVIGTASLDIKNVRSAFSDYGSDCIDISAPGENIYSLSHPALSPYKKDINAGSGTSFAAPQVSAAIALLWAEKRHLNNWEISRMLRESGQVIDQNQTGAVAGHVGKLLDVEKLLTLSQPTLPDTIIENAQIKGKELWITGTYINRDTIIQIEYTKDGQVKTYSPGSSVKGYNQIVSQISSIPVTENDYNIFLIRNGGKNKSNTIKVSQDFLQPCYKNCGSIDADGINNQPSHQPNENANQIEEKPLFTDLSFTHANYAAIRYLKYKNIIGGYPDKSFRPQITVNRAELLKILVGAKKITPTLAQYSSCFPDVNQEWFAPYVCYAKATGWIAGYPDGKFRPDQPVNKAEAIKILVNSQGYSLPASIDQPPYADVAMNQWYTPFIKTAKDKGLLEEQSQIVGISQYMSRAGISENIYRSLIVQENKLDSFIQYQTSFSNTGLVKKVIDGDTLQMADGSKVRLIGIDAPETSQNECYAQESTDYLASLTQDKEITLTRDTLNSDKDKYGRLLRYIYLENENINLKLIQEGYAVYYGKYPFELADTFRQTEKQSKEQKLGLWSACKTE